MKKRLRRQILALLAFIRTIESLSWKTRTGEIFEILKQIHAELCVTDDEHLFWNIKLKNDRKKLEQALRNHPWFSKKKTAKGVEKQEDYELFEKLFRVLSKLDEYRIAAKKSSK